MYKKLSRLERKTDLALPRCMMYTVVSHATKNRLHPRRCREPTQSSDTIKI